MGDRVIFMTHLNCTPPSCHWHQTTIFERKIMKISLRTTTLLVMALVFLFITGASPRAATTRVFVEFAPGAKAAVSQALQAQGASFHYTFDGLNSFVVTLPAAALRGLEHNPNVVSLEEDVPRELYASPLANVNALLADTVDPNGQIVPYGIDNVQARDVWDADRDGNIDAGAPTGAGRTVCIIDTGFYNGHEDLASLNLVGGYSQIAGEAYTEDGNGHGSHVAGTIAGANNSLGVVGVSPGTVSLYIVKFFNNDGVATFSSDLIDGINRCQSGGADIISMSLGGGRASGKERRAFNNLYDAGILHIAAAGNDGNTAYSYPASYDSVVSVAAVDINNAIADFSQQNDQVEIAAPGVGVLSTVPYLATDTLTVGGTTYTGSHIEYAGYGSPNGPLVDGGECTSSGSWSGQIVLCARGTISFLDKVNNVIAGGGAAAIIYNNEPGGFGGTLGEGASSSIPAMSLSQEDGQVLVANNLGQTANVVSTLVQPANGYEAYNGTSMATPHVSGVAALVWSANPSWSNVQIREALQVTAVDLGAAGKDNAFGYGLVQAQAALNYLGGGTPVNNPPSVTITSPADGTTVSSGASVSFAGSATDAEDGDITNSLVWTSDLDGQIGTGGSFSAILSEGSHTITAVATDSENATGSAVVNVTVDGGGTGGGDLVASVSTDKATYSNRQTAVITVLVTDGTSPVSGATVELQIVAPDGGQSGGTGTTDANGEATFTFKLNTKRDGTGTYTVNVTASKSGYNAGLASTTFLGQ